MQHIKEAFKTQFSDYKKSGEKYVASYRTQELTPFVGPDLMAYQWLEEVEKRQGDTDLAYIILGMITAIIRPEEFVTELENAPVFNKETLKIFLEILKNDQEFRGDINIVFLAELLL